MRTPILCALAALAPGALAQQAIITPAPTTPSEGRFVLRTLYSYTSFSDDPTGQGRDGYEHLVTTTIDYGITSDLAFSLSIPVANRNIDATAPAADSQITSAGDLSLQLKYRFWQNDPGPVDTSRLAAFAGVELPTGHEDLSSHSVDPYVGLTFMHIAGRYGFNQSVAWKFTTGAADSPLRAGSSLADEFRSDTAYLFRISPAQYGEDFVAALYAVAELNARIETNGDAQLFLSPGLLYEAPSWAFEIGVSIPVAQDLEHRPETDFAITAGLRFLF